MDTHTNTPTDPGLVEGYAVFELLAAGRAMPVTVRLSWRAADPHAVEMTFRTGRTARRDVSWTLARELLAEGLHTPVGLADVLVEPHPYDPDLIIVQLASDGGRALFRTDAWPIAEFLDRTYQQVRPGYESEALDLDAELEQLLERGLG